jgi:hypothetical protein
MAWSGAGLGYGRVGRAAPGRGGGSQYLEALEADTL